MLNHTNRARWAGRGASLSRRRCFSALRRQGRTARAAEPGHHRPGGGEFARRRRGAAHRRARPISRASRPAARACGCTAACSTDEWKSSDTFSQRNETDQRSIQTNNANIADARTTTSSRRAASLGRRSTSRSSTRRSEGQHRARCTSRSASRDHARREFLQRHPADVHGRTACPYYGPPLTNDAVFKRRGDALRQRAGAGAAAADAMSVAHEAGALVMRKARMLVDHRAVRDRGGARSGERRADRLSSIMLTFDQTTGDNQIWTSATTARALHA